MTFGIKIVIKYEGKPKLIYWQKQTNVTTSAKEHSISFTNVKVNTTLWKMEIRPGVVL